MNITIPEEELYRTRKLIELKIYDVIESIDGTFLYTVIPKAKKIAIKGLYFFPCIDDESSELIYVARSKNKVYKVVFPIISKQEIDALSKFNTYTKRADKFNPNLTNYILYAVIAVIVIVISYIIYNL
ncbi:MAG: hypothetical protein KQ78_00300 [Candidatus Izimaplasma bacterium HR2]|nr:MAG: hypothetical protein KQ78_00300 [Candidatus Izimaplasma bacterium HR2]